MSRSRSRSRSRSPSGRKAPADAKICRYEHEKPGTCHFAAACKFSHEKYDEIDQNNLFPRTAKDSDICFDFVNHGVCRKPNCKFDHPRQKRLNPSETDICFDYQNKGFCVRGMTCRFQHGSSKPISMPGSGGSPAQSNVCYDFQNKGICVRGVKCPYEHTPKQQTMCFAFLKGQCNRGGTCKFSHVIEQGAPGGPTPTGGPASLMGQMGQLNQLSSQISQLSQMGQQMSPLQQLSATQLQMNQLVNQLNSLTQMNSQMQQIQGGAQGAPGQGRRPAKSNACFDFQNGKCTRGDKCPFDHIDASKCPCPFILKSGFCRLGAKCRFRHDSAALGIPASALSDLPGRKISSNVCYDFQKGKCTRGENCPFDHVEAGKSPCPYLVHAGFCRTGDRCRFSHDPAVLPASFVPQAPPANKSNACFDFQNNKCSRENCPYEHIESSKCPCPSLVNQGHCRFGANCRFKHEGVQQIVAPAINEQFNMQQQQQSSGKPTHCYDFQNTGKCSRENCSFDHLDPAQSPCPDLSNSGYCRFGDSCRFFHDPARSGGGSQNFFQGGDQMSGHDGPSGRRQNVCYDFQNNGSCARGEDCPFEHVESAKSQCPSLLNVGYCRFGDGCRFSHDGGQQNTPAPQVQASSGGSYQLPQVQAAQPCIELLTTGACRYGSTCRFLHEVQRQEQQQAAINMMHQPQGQSMNQPSNQSLNGMSGPPANQGWGAPAVNAMGNVPMNQYGGPSGGNQGWGSPSQMNQGYQGW